MGQNFLIDKSVLSKVVETAQLDQKDIVLEIGPGIGTLTQALAKTTKKVIGIEKDRVMIKILQETLRDFNNTEIIQENALKFNPATCDLRPGGYKVVANIPYYLTSPIIRKFLEETIPPKEMVLMVQKEVAQRICARPPDMSLLAVSVQFYANAKIISYVSKNCFWPAPKVDSAIIAIRPQNDLPAQAGAEINAERRKKIDTNLFFKIVKAGFSQPRKQLAGNLAKALKVDKGGITTWLLKNNIQPTQRAETLSVDEWIGLVSTNP